MATPRELFLELLRPEGQPERQLVQYEALSMIFPDPAGNPLLVVGVVVAVILFKRKED